MITTHDEIVELIVNGAPYPLRHGILTREYDDSTMTDWSVEATAMHGVPLDAGEHELTVAVIGERLVARGLLLNGGSLTSHRFVRGVEDLRPAD